MGYIKNHSELEFEYHLISKDAKTHLVFAFDNELILLDLKTNYKEICSYHSKKIQSTFIAHNSIYSLDENEFVKWSFDGKIEQKNNVISGTFYIQVIDDELLLVSKENNSTLFYSLTSDLFEFKFEADMVGCNTNLYYAAQDKQLVIVNRLSLEQHIKKFKHSILKVYLQTIETETKITVILSNGQILQYEYTINSLTRCFEIHFSPPKLVLLNDNHLLFVMDDKVLVFGYDFRLCYTINIPNITNIVALPYDDANYTEYIYTTLDSINRFVKVNDSKSISSEYLGTLLPPIKKSFLFNELFYFLCNDCYYTLNNTIWTKYAVKWDDAIVVTDQIVYKQDKAICCADLSSDVGEDFLFGNTVGQDFIIVTKTRILVMTTLLKIKAVLQCSNTLKAILYHQRVYILKSKSLEWQSISDVSLKKKFTTRKYNLIDFDITNAQIQLSLDDHSIIKVLDVDALVVLHTKQFLSNPIDSYSIMSIPANFILKNNNVMVVMHWNANLLSNEFKLLCSGSPIHSIILYNKQYYIMSTHSIKVWTIDFHPLFLDIQSTKQDLLYFRIVQLVKPYSLASIKSVLSIQQLRDFICLKGLSLTTDDYTDLISEIEIQSTLQPDYQLDLMRCLLLCEIYKEKAIVEPTILDERLTEIGDVLTLEELLLYQS